MNSVWDYVFLKCQETGSPVTLKSCFLYLQQHYLRKRQLGNGVSEPRFTLQLFIWASANVEIISFYLLLHLQRVFVALFSERRDHNNNREPLPRLGMGISNRVFLYPYPTWILPLCLTLNFQKSFFQNISKTNGCEAQKGYSKPIPQAMVNHCPPKKKLKGVKTPLL